MVGIRDDSKHHKYAEKELSQISPANRELAGRYLVAKKAQGSRPATLG